MAEERTHLGVSPRTKRRLDLMREGIMSSFDKGGPVPCEPTEPEKRAGRPHITYDALINALLDQRDAHANRRESYRKRKRAARPRPQVETPLPDAPQ